MQQSKQSLITGVFALIVTSCAAFRVEAVTIDFEELALESSDSIGIASGYIENGFVFTIVGMSNPPGTEFWVAGTLNPRFSGSTSLSSQITDATIVLQSTDNRPFSLSALNLAALNTPAYGLPDNFSGALVVTFTGSLATGGLVNQSFNVDYSSFAQQTLIFDSSFTGLKSVSWIQSSPYHQFDNVIIDEPFAAVVLPESGTLVLIGLGLAAIGSGRSQSHGKRRDIHTRSGRPSNSTLAVDTHLSSLFELTKEAFGKVR